MPSPAHDRAAWLACYAPEAVLYDPVGGSPLDPEGNGLRGHAALDQFWQLAVAPNEVRFTISAVHPAGDEAAVIASVSTRLPNRALVNYDGVFVYRTNRDGRIVSLRGYWDVRHLLAGFSA